MIIGQVKIPKLDLTSIYLQREAPPSNEKPIKQTKAKAKNAVESESSSSECDIGFSEEEDIETPIVKDQSKSNFQEEKMKFKEKML